METINFNNDNLELELAKAVHQEELQKEEKKLNRLKEERRLLIEEKTKDLPTQSGLYYLVFPNGKFFFGSSNNLRKRIQYHLYCLFPLKKEDLKKWYKKCLEENPSLTYSKVVVKVEVCDDYVEKKRAIREKIKGDSELKEKSYNS